MRVFFLRYDHTVYYRSYISYIMSNIQKYSVTRNVIETQKSKIPPKNTD